MAFWSRRPKHTPEPPASRSQPSVPVPVSPFDGADPSPTTSDPELFPTPMTSERIAQILRADGAHFGVDDDGDCIGFWQLRMFLFVLYGETPAFLQIRGTWSREASIERLDEILDFINDWNTERIWPKAYARVRDDGAVSVSAEVAVDLEKGGNDAQIRQVIRCGLASGTSFFDALDERYPDPVAQSPAL